MKKKHSYLYLFLVNILLMLLFLQACGLATTRPKLEMSLAAAALLAAKDTKADRYASTLYRKGEYYYLKAKSSYKRKYFNKAKQYAILSRKVSERAEYKAVRKDALEEE